MSSEPTRGSKAEARYEWLDLPEWLFPPVARHTSSAVTSTATATGFQKLVLRRIRIANEMVSEEPRARNVAPVFPDEDQPRRSTQKINPGDQPGRSIEYQLFVHSLVCVYGIYSESVIYNPKVASDNATTLEV